MISKRLIAFSILFTLGAAAAGCASSTADDSGQPVADDAALTFSTGPEGLAQWLGTNHSLRVMTQYFDTRGGSNSSFPVLQPVPWWETIPPLTFPTTASSNDEVKNIIGFGRQADDRSLAIKMGKPQKIDPVFGEAFGPLGVYVHEGHAEWLAEYAQNPQSGKFDVQYIDEAHRAQIDQAIRETTAEVTILLGPDADGEAGPSGHFAFGIVKRPLTNRPGAPVNSYWTLLAAEYTWGLNLPFADVQ